MRGLLTAALFSLLYGPLLAYTILVDPGHGGKDKGAKTRLLLTSARGRSKSIRIFEKDIALQVSKRIHKGLKRKGYKAFLTRSIDRTVTLQERASLVKRINPDVYISVHVNSSKNRWARGFETYYLDNHNDIAVKKLEEVENKNVMGEELVIDQILRDLIIERTVKTSRGLAKTIHHHINRTIARPFKMMNRGVRPGAFYVLTLAKRPSILLEVGFLSNPKELRKILRPKFQEKYAQAVVRGIDRYVKKVLR